MISTAGSNRIKPDLRKGIPVGSDLSLKGDPDDLVPRPIATPLVGLDLLN